MTKITIQAIAVSIFGLAAAAFAQNHNAPVLRALQSTEAQRALTEHYWTAERLAGARPMPTPQVDAATVIPSQVERAPDLLPAPRMLPGTPPRAGRAQNDATGTRSGDLLSSIKMLQQPSVSPSDTTITVHTIATFAYEFPFHNYQVPDVSLYPYSAVGKLFFVVPEGASTDPGEHVCSGAVFYDSHTVLTARHCMYDAAKGLWYSNFKFFPAWNGGPNPAFNNSWTVRQALTWANNTSQDYDIGLLQLNDAAGFGCDGSSGTQPIAYYTGSLGVMFFGALTQYGNLQETVLGYPQDAPFNGDYMYQNEAVISVINPFGALDIVELGNPQTGGSSGGPWIVGLDPDVAANGSNNTTTATNLITGLNSFKWTNPDQPLAMNSPGFFAYNLWNLYLSYRQLPCP